MQNDDFGDRMKRYETQETNRMFLPRLPVYARIDGRCFSRFTKDFQRPFDPYFSSIMVETTKALVRETNAVMGYTQSDEISLCWYTDKPESQIFFNGRIFKMTSVLASMTTSFFMKACYDSWEHFRIYWDRCMLNPPSFDCRVFVLPNLTEAANAFLWREQDATKNAISMAASHYFSHKELQGKNGKQMQEMLWQQYNINFNDYPSFFKRGTFVQKENYYVNMDTIVLRKDGTTATGNPTQVIRSRIVALDMPKFSTVKNRVEVIFNKDNPIVEGDILNAQPD